MPPAIIGAIITAAAGLTEMGVSLANRPGTPKAPGISQPTQQQINTKRDLVSQQLPTIQSQVGGSVSPDYFKQMATQLSGVQNQPGAGTGAQEAVSQFFGGGGGAGAGAPGITGGTGLTGRGAGGGLSDALLQQLQEHIVGGTNA